MGQVTQRLEDRVCRAIGVVLLTVFGSGACSSQVIHGTSGAEGGAGGQKTEDGATAPNSSRGGTAAGSPTVLNADLVHAVCDNVQGPTAYCEAGTCVNKKQISAACATDDECASGKCERGFCVTYSVAAGTWCGGSLN